MAAPFAYFDTSVLVKRYAREPGSPRARSLLRSHRFLSSAIAPVEAVSALHRRRVAGELGGRDFTTIMSRIAKDRAYWELIEVTATVLRQAEDLIAQVGVRTLDAIHIASVVEFRNAAGMAAVRMPFITADMEQRDAAVRLGLPIRWVG